MRVYQVDQAIVRCFRTAAGVLTPAIQEGESFTFTMCNPPFFESMEEAGQNPATAFSGTAAEMVCPGGELAFVTRMVTDSLQLKVSPDSPDLQSVCDRCDFQKGVCPMELLIHIILAH